MEKNERNGIEPLPGDRQGTFGAGAERDNMRDTGGMQLRRQAAVRQEAIAPNEHRELENIPREEHQNPTEADGSQPINRTAAARTERARRIRWTKDMNMEIIRTFYYVNQCQDEPLPGWRHQFHVEITRRFPELNLSEQNAVDRKNVIIRKKFLTDTEINTLKREVGNRVYQENMLQEAAADTEYPIEEEQPDVIENQPTPDEKTEKLRTKFLSILAFYEGVDPSERPRIPSLKGKKYRRESLKTMDRILKDHLNGIDDLAQIQQALYSAAATVVEYEGYELIRFPMHSKPRKNETTNEPKWKLRLEKNINEYRAEADLIREYLNGIKTKKVLGKVSKIARRANIILNEKSAPNKLNEHRDIIRQKLKVKAARLRRYNETSKRKQQNQLFETDQKKIYKNIEAEKPARPSSNINIDIFNEYWKDIWSEPVLAEHNPVWIHEIEKATNHLPGFEIQEITEEDVSRAVKKTINWKSPGPDCIQNFWLKQLPSSHDNIAKAFNKVLDKPDVFPSFLTKGITFMQYKKGNPADPKNYRPITCLSVLYKLFTSILNEYLYQYCEQNEIIAVQH